MLLHPVPDAGDVVTYVEDFYSVEPTEAMQWDGSALVAGAILGWIFRRCGNRTITAEYREASAQRPLEGEEITKASARFIIHHRKGVKDEAKPGDWIVLENTARRHWRGARGDYLEFRVWPKKRFEEAYKDAEDIRKMREEGGEA